MAEGTLHYLRIHQRTYANAHSSTRRVYHVTFPEMRHQLTRRDFLAVASATSLASAQSKKPIPVGLELFSVRGELKKDLFATVTAVAKMGYEVVEFYSPYFGWTADYAKQVRTLLDDLGIEARSMHSPRAAFEPEGRQKAVELNSIVGSTSVVMASAGGRFETVDEWKRVAELLTQSQELFEKSGIRAGYHNHGFEWRPMEGKSHAMDILAAGTPESVTLQLDVGTAVEMEIDPVAWIKAHPGRIRNIHCKDWTPGSHEDGKAYRVLFGEGKSPWREIFAAAESGGGVEFYLIEQEGSRYSEFETAQRCLNTYKQMRA